MVTSLEKIKQACSHSFAIFVRIQLQANGILFKKNEEEWSV